MYQFIVMLRAIVCLLITNSHQENIYPIRILASGGLLGDVIFFAISGYLLYSLKQQHFGPWYAKRLRRVYPAVWLTAGTFIVSKIYGSISFRRFCELMFYPTHYHFVASILVLYILFFFLMKFINRDPGQRVRRMGYIALAAAAVYFVAFYTVFDRSYYHIDDVNSKMIWPLFLLSMMIGAYFRIHEEKFLNKGGFLPWLACAGCAVLYFGTKLCASRGIIPPSVQWINQVTLLMLLVCIFRCFIGIEKVIVKIPSAVKAPFEFIASIAFELYLAQAVIIPTFNPGKELFPYNLLVTLSITLLCAWLVHSAVEIILQLTDMLFKKGAAKK